MKKYLPYYGLILVAFIVGLLLWTYKANLNGNTVIATVGEEKIYKKDLDFELSRHPQRSDPETRDMIVDQMIRDSVILQAAKKEGKIILSDDFYNSDSKDLIVRAEKVRNVINEVNSQTSQINGTVVTIWFFNNNHAGSLGYEKGKAFAYNKITNIRDMVSTNEIDISEAVSLIVKDDSLTGVDTAYKTNAKVDFSVKNGERVVFDDSVNEVIWELSEGEVSEVLTMTEDSPLRGEDYPVAYAFVYISEKNNNGDYDSFESWYENHEKNIEIKI